jgi:hypothetical protein
VLLTITTTFQPATDLGHLLRKHPGRVHSAELSFGRAHVFYPEATNERCTAALLLDIDPVGLVRNRRGPGGEGRALEKYVNDRPYVASSFLSVAIADVFGSAMSGKSKERPELVERPLPLTIRISVLPCRDGEAFLRRLFEPLGYGVSATEHRLDDKFSDWGESAYFTVTIEGNLPLRQVLTHLYVLLPVLDNDKHYWVGEHLDPPRLAAFERVVFECAKPATVVLTTPNSEYNVKWENLPAGRFRHKDHRFEWTRSQFESWANEIAGRFGYGVRFLPVGPEDSTLGAPTQMGIFERA